MARQSARPVVIKKVKKGHGHGHHGGGWKIAYADFATAMMAFFLLLWLLAATTEEQKLGLANFFMPTPFIKNEMVGGHGISGGEALSQSGVLDTSPLTRPDVTLARSPRPTRSERDQALTAEEEPDEALAGPARRQQIERAEEAELQRVRAVLSQAIENDPELAGLGQNLRIDRTDEGVRIQIVDQDQRSMFPLGSTVMQPCTQALMARVATVVDRTGRQVSVTGHTDPIPFRSGSVQDNWQLSSDRANASRRGLIAAGLPADRIARVVGKADTGPLDPAQPDAAQNRRISIVLLRQPMNRPGPALPPAP